MSLYLHGTGHFHSEVEITNKFLEDLDIGTNDAWITERVGIKSRRTVLPLDYIKETRNSDLAAADEAALYTHAQTGKTATEMAVARAGINLTDIGMVIAGSSAPGSLSPSDASMIANELGLEVPSFDVNSACTSLSVAVYLLSMMRDEMLPDYVLMVTPESLTQTVSYNDRSSAVIWGDCTTAMIVSTKHRSNIEILGTSLDSSPAGWDKVRVPRRGHFTQEGRTVQMFAIKKTIRCLRKLQKEFTDPARSLHFIGHQANLLMLQSVCEHCKIEDARHHTNVVDFANTASAGAASVISQEWDTWKSGDDLAVVGVGSGLSWSSYLLRFREGS